MTTSLTHSIKAYIIPQSRSYSCISSSCTIRRIELLWTSCRSQCYICITVYFSCLVSTSLNLPLICCVLQCVLLKKKSRAVTCATPAPNGWADPFSLRIFPMYLLYMHFPLAWGVASNSKNVHCDRAWCCHHGTASGAESTLFSSCISAFPMILSSCMPKASVTEGIRGKRIIILEYFERMEYNLFSVLAFI